MTTSLALGLPSLWNTLMGNEGTGRVHTGSRTGRQTGRLSSHVLWAEWNDRTGLLQVSDSRIHQICVCSSKKPTTAKLLLSYVPTRMIIRMAAGRHKSSWSQWSSFRYNSEGEKDRPWATRGSMCVCVCPRMCMRVCGGLHVFVCMWVKPF